MSAAYDRRITPARADLAAAHLKGKVDAARFAAGRVLRAARGIVDLRKSPEARGALETQILFGEMFTAYEESGGWFWGQSAHDSYVGYARADGFTAEAARPSHRVVVRTTPLLSGPDVKDAAIDLLPLNAKLAVIDTGPRFAKLTEGYVFAGHIAPLSEARADWVTAAESFIGVPYVWGGKTALGCDCSGLIQTALEAGGIAAPRDADMMESALGHSLPEGSPLLRGDLVFWKGHMGVMLDATTLLHANAHFMQVTAEPLTAVRERIAVVEGAEIRTIRRL